MTTNTHLSFDKQHYQLPIPFYTPSLYAIYANFASILTPNTQQTNGVTLHEACGYGYVIIGPEGHSVKLPFVFRGEDVATHFIQSLLREEKDITSILKKIVPLNMTPHDETLFKSAMNCHIFDEPLEVNRVKDHCHLTGIFWGANHNKSNLNYKLSFKIPVILHNAKNYDTHIIMQALGGFKDQKIQSITNNMGKYITFSIGKLQFLDSV